MHGERVGRYPSYEDALQVVRASERAGTLQPTHAPPTTSTVSEAQP